MAKIERENSKIRRELERLVLKTLTAFLNTDGGTLLIGVADDRSMHGVEKDGFPNDDKYLLHFWNLVKDFLDKDLGRCIDAYFERVEGKKGLAVRCSKSPQPVYLGQEKSSMFAPAQATRDLV
jgi:predicted HTH transcriptional regulator